MTGIATVTPDSAVIGQFAYANLATPVVLQAGTEYVISGTQEGPAADGGNIDPIIQGGSITLNGITLDTNDLSYYGPATDSPHYPDSGNGQNIGPTFAFTPEPGTAAIFALGSLFLVRRRSQR